MAEHIQSTRGPRERAQFGGWVWSSSPQVVRTFLQSDLDFVTFDTQHSALTLAECGAAMYPAKLSGTPIYIRVDSNDLSKIGKALDLGARGVIVPLVESAAEAEAAVRASVFPPNGGRSWGPVHPDLAGLSVAEVEAGLEVFVMVETALGLANAAEIAAVKGIAGIFIGPADLSIALGLDPRTAFSSDQLAQQFAELAWLCSANNIRFGAYARSVESARRWAEWGCDFIPVSDDGSLLASALTALTTELIGEASRQPVSTY